MPSESAANIALGHLEADKDLLAKFLLRSFDEGCIDADGGWPSEWTMRWLGFHNDHFIWEYFIRDTE